MDSSIHLIDVIIGLGIAVLFILALVSSIRHRKNGCGLCGGDCRHCHKNKRK